MRSFIADFAKTAAKKASQVMVNHSTHNAYA